MAKKSKGEGKAKPKTNKKSRDDDDDSSHDDAQQKCSIRMSDATTTVTGGRREPTPKNGWARELRQAEKALKHNTNPHHHEECTLRTARAYRIMRQFDKLRKLVVRQSNSNKSSRSRSQATTTTTTTTTTSTMSEDGMETLYGYMTEIDNIEERMGNFQWSSTKHTEMIQIFHEIRHDDRSINDIMSGHESFGYLNLTQYAAASGDIPLMERLVALGAAIDYKSNKQGYFDDDDNDNDSGGGGGNSASSHKKRCNLPGATPLLIALTWMFSLKMSLNMGLVPYDERERCQGIYDAQLEIATQLVWLGADSHVKVLPIPPNLQLTTFMLMPHLMRLVGKSAYELASTLGERELLYVMNQLDTTEKKIKLVHCRCGSRLPWSECHYSKEFDMSYYLKEADKDGHELLVWRYSPLAPCPCKNTKKTYFRCCWEETFGVTYMDDVTGKSWTSFVRSVNSSSIRKENGVEDDGNQSDYWRTLTTSQFIRKVGQPTVRKITEDIHPKRCVEEEMNHTVCAGTIQRIPDDLSIYLSEIHYALPKQKLLLRVKAWNEALEKYCDDKGLGGERREEVIRLHKASPLAPCANLKCDRIETKVKEFRKCSRCSFVAYCSVDCQRQDWKAVHKKKCISWKNFSSVIHLP